MTLAADDRYQTSTPVTTTSVFTIDFPIFSLSDDITVYIDGTLTTAYAITGTAVGGAYTDATLTLTTGISNQTIEIIGTRDPNRPGDLINGTDLITNINAELDVRTAELQEIDREVGRSVRVPYGLADGAGVLDTLVAGKLLAVNGTATGITQTSLPTTSSQPFPLVSQITAGDYSAYDYLWCPGHSAHGDGGQSLWYKTTEPSHSMKKQDTAGNWFVYVPGESGINARAAGYLPDETAANNSTALTAATSMVNATNFNKLTIPPGIYTTAIGTTAVGTAMVNIGLTKSDIHIVMDDAKIILTATAEAVFIDLNTAADAAENTITNRHTVYGGHIIHQTPYATTANTVTGIRARGVTRTVIENVWFEDIKYGIVANPRDAMTIDKCKGFQNDIHVWIEDYQTDDDNPQNLDILSCHWGLHYDKGVYIQGNASMIHIDRGYYIGEHAIVVENGSSQAANFNNDSVQIKRIDFEQGTLVTLTGSWTFTSGSTTVTAPGANGAATTELAAGYRVETAGNVVYTVASVTDDDNFELTANASATETTVTAYRAKPYIDVLDTNSRTLVGLNIEECKFSAFDGVTTAAHVLHLRDVTNWTVSKITVAGRAPGWIWIDSACTNGTYGPVAKTGTANLIHFDCGREEISCIPAVIDFPAYNGGNGNLIYNNAAVSDGDSATVDMSATIGAAYWPDDIPPRGYDIALGARDSGSAAAGAGAAYLSVLPTSATAAGERFRYATVEVAGITNDRYLAAQGYVPADDNGDIYVLINATGASTLDAYVTAKRMWM